MTEKQTKTTTAVTVRSGWDKITGSTTDAATLDAVVGIIGEKYRAGIKSDTVGAMRATAAVFAAGGEVDGKPVNVSSFARVAGMSRTYVQALRAGGQALALGVSEDDVTRAYSGGYMHASAVTAAIGADGATGVTVTRALDKARADKVKVKADNKSTRKARTAGDDEPTPAKIKAKGDRKVTARNLTDSIIAALGDTLTDAMLRGVSEEDRVRLANALAEASESVIRYNETGTVEEHAGSNTGGRG